MIVCVHLKCLTTVWSEKTCEKKYIVILLQVIETSVESQESRRKTSGSSSSRPYKMKRFSVFPIRVSLISNGANYRHEPSHVPGEPRLDCITKHLRLKPGVFFLCLNNKRAGLFIGWTNQAGKEKEHLHTSGRPAWFWFVAETRMGASRRRGGCVCVCGLVCVCVSMQEGCCVVEREAGGRGRSEQLPCHYVRSHHRSAQEPLSAEGSGWLPAPISSQSP